MQNAVPDVALRTLEGRYDTYVDEVGRLFEATFEIMRRTGSVDPKVSDIVREAGMSNQAFYRHFKGKDELLVALLADGVRQLLETLERMMSRERQPADRIRRWIEGVLKQAASTDAAARTRPFVVHSARLANQFPEAVRRSNEAVQAPLLAALRALPSPDPERDAAAVHELAMGTMHRHLIEGTTPSAADIAHVVWFSLAAAGRRTG